VDRRELLIYTVYRKKSIFITNDADKWYWRFLPSTTRLR